MLLDNYMDGKPVIVYDAHEAKTFVVRYLKEFPEVTPVRRALEIADYLVQTAEGTIAVERKRATDFMSSISDGRLFEQAENLLEYDDPRIILEGAIFTSVKSGRCYTVDTLGKVINVRRYSRTQPRTMWSTQFFVHPHAFISLLEKLQDMGIKLILTGSAYDTADTLRYWATRKEGKESLEIRRKTRIFSDHERQLYLLSGLTGVSTKRAAVLLEKFGTPLKAFQAFLDYSPKTFPVEGIGEKTVMEVRKLLTSNLANVPQEKLTEYEFREGVMELGRILLGKEAELKKENIPELKKLLKARGLGVGGRKEELLGRLLGAMGEAERIDMPLFLERYETLLGKKTELQHVPEHLQREYERFKLATSQAPRRG